VRNNPVNLTDPDGLNPLIGAGLGFAGGAAFGAGSSIVSDLMNGRDIDWGRAGRGALIGGVTGAVAGATFGLTMPAAGAWGASVAGGRSLLVSIIGYKVGSLSAVVGDVAGQNLEIQLGWRECWSWEQTGTAAVMGGFFGAQKREFTLRNGMRIAPFGNRAGNKNGTWPHYHRAKPDPSHPSQNLPGQNIRRHRPWDSHATDRTLGDRF
jgi:hypothetical protein